jgi:mitogen-activated protein kinase 1/3
MVDFANVVLLNPCTPTLTHSRLTSSRGPLPVSVALLVYLLTRVDPRKRYTVEQCLAHPYLDAYHDPEDEPAAKPLDADFFDFDMQKEAIGREELKRYLYEEIMTFNPSA